MRKPLVIILFVLVMVAQLYFTASGIIERESVLDSGKEFRFKTAPVDPSDPFRGKYITLNYDENKITVNPDSKWEHGEAIFVHLKTDRNGFAKIKAISKKRPGDVDYVKATISYVSYVEDKIVYIEYPFTRFYMEESKAPAAEIAYNKASRDSSAPSYALVVIKDGMAVLKDVVIKP